MYDSLSEGLSPAILAISENFQQLARIKQILMYHQEKKSTSSHVLAFVSQVLENVEKWPKRSTIAHLSPFSFFCIFFKVCPGYLKKSFSSGANLNSSKILLLARLICKFDKDPNKAEHTRLETFYPL